MELLIEQGNVFIAFTLVNVWFHPLREKCPYSEFFWFVFTPNAGKYGPEKLRIRTLFTQWTFSFFKKNFSDFSTRKLPHKHPGFNSVKCFSCNQNFRISFFQQLKQFYKLLNDSVRLKFPRFCRFSISIYMEIYE